MTSYTFKPSAKAFPKLGETVNRTIEVTCSPDGLFYVNEKPLSEKTMQHAIAFAIKQRLANSFVSASTAKNESGQLLPEAERLTLWGASFDKVLGKITDPEASPDWQSVFTGAERESADPFTVEVNRIAAAQLKAVASAKGKTLPKVTTPEYKTLLAGFLDKRRDAIESEAKRRLEEVAAIADLDDLDLDDLK